MIYSKKLAVFTLRPEIFNPKINKQFHLYEEYFTT